MLSGCSTIPLESPEQATVVDSTTGQAKPATASVNPAAAATYNQALTAIKQGNNTLATRLLTAMSKDYPKLSGPPTNLGLIYFREGDLDRAEAAFQQALALNPENAVAHQHMGIIYRHQGKFEQSEQAYLKAIKSQPDYANAHLNLAILYDIYLLKLNNSLRHYEKYQSLQSAEDNTVKKWIIGLKQRIKVSK
jgi:Tfp pilus assembly protein PilF